MNIVFGPINSRRFGISLGVDLSPSKKQCNFDCVYCELKGAKSIEYFSDVVPLADLLQSVKDGLKKHDNINVLTITANGEPTMYPYLLEFIREIKPHIPKHIKSLILSNGSLFGKESVQEALKYFDMVKFSLDSLDIKSYKKVDRIHKSLSLESIKEGIKSYASIRKNTLICEILLVSGINDNLDSMQPLADFLREIKVDRIDLGTIDRPPAYNVKPVSIEKINEIREIFNPLFVSVVKREANGLNSILSLNEDEILELMQRRPLEVNEAESMLDDKSKEILKHLTKVNKLQIKNVDLIDFYTL